MTITEQVRNLLAYSEKARDSDKVLIGLYLRRAGVELDNRQIDQLMNLPSFETITRIRRKLQESGEFQPSPEVAKERKLKSYAVQQNAPNASPERIEQVLRDGSKVSLPSGYAISEE